MRPLSPREQEIADCLLAGEHTKDIAWLLGISPGTVHSHLVTLFRKLEVRNRRSAVTKIKERSILGKG